MNRHPARRGRTGIGRPWHTRSTTQKLWTVLRALCLVVAAALALGLPAQAASRGRTAQAPQSTTVALADIVSTKASVYALAADHTAVYEWSGLGTLWNQIGGPAANIYAGPDTLYATNPTTGDIWQYRPTLDQVNDYGGWTMIGGPGAAFTTADGHLYGLNPDHSAVYEYTGKPKVWKPVGGPADQIYGGETLYATNPNTGDSKGNINQYDRKHNKWTVIGGPGAAFTTADGHLYGLNPDHSAVFRYTGSKNTWTSLGAPVTGPATTQEKAQLLNDLAQPGDAARTAWNRTRNAYFTNPAWDRFQFDWDSNYCNYSPDKIPFFHKSLITDFRLACARHDFGYHNYKHEDMLNLDDLGTTDKGREAKHRVDDIFHKDMNHACDVNSSSTPNCKLLATLYFQAVEHLGSDSQLQRYTDMFDPKKLFDFRPQSMF